MVHTGVNESQDEEIMRLSSKLTKTSDEVQRAKKQSSQVHAVHMMS